VVRKEDAERKERFARRPTFYVEFRVILKLVVAPDEPQLAV
jgi:hypothetical protein